MENGNDLILVVDDEPKNIRYLGNILREKGYNISFASDGEKALLLLEQTKPDLILLDIMMPGIDGFEVCTRIKRNPELMDIPIIFLSSQTKTEYIVNGFKAGSVDYVIKPFNPAELLARVKTQIEIKKAQKAIINLNRELEAVNKKLEQELLHAAEYVKSLLPDNISSEQITTDWQYIPSSYLGGDSFGFHWLDENNLAVYLLDVSGHGVNSALLSVSILNLIKTHSLVDADFNDPKSVLAALNSKFSIEENVLNFFTIWYGVINTTKKEIIYSSAGHPPAILLKELDQPVLLKGEGIWIGAVKDFLYKNHSFQITGENKLYVFSDGLFEITDGKENSFSYNDLLNIITSSAFNGGNPLNKILSSLSSANDNKKFEDDLAIMELKLHL
ncbi:MAG: response regulator [Ignavibacteriaceae bacterium]|nr:response regulator [Ignavibacteriaceae bacterium]